ncbi:uncharacterized protein SPPG_04069 [Spizellomyces punctatus DAOM BR117]|uniref:Uncharacterized protein n=1 Tax=Spizellomyces punctatus (strain DAOM BR117) TaxID=645134 RepID=A0A0L0HJ95_SPIPD|nr:uncharacterized protein SPPG_04069 [Spizellomyces punctatus DAOM BR117]KND00970.1 hypothetical protein SPPG_04069 [Spizellomyces punctatus DAOM BR117]|eukprot:XP_016609009.1 hypothetical protein SPPG_04069 [Spizellomyces punctatus DAOM BR117]
MQDQDGSDHHQRDYHTRDVLANFIIGASVSLISSCLSSLGVNLQASALKAQRERNLALDESDEDVPVDPPGYIAEQRNGDKYGSITSHNHDTSLAPSEPEGASFVCDQRSRGRKPESVAEYEQSSTVRERDPSSTSSRSFKSWFSLDSYKTSKSSWKLSRYNTDTWREFLNKWQWYMGFSMYLICQLFGSVVALGFVSPVILAPLGSASLIFNVIFSRVFLGTRITASDWLGTLLVVVGCAIVSTFGSGVPEERQTIDDLIRLFRRPTFIVYFTIQGVLVLITFLLIKYLEYGLGALKFFVAIRRRSASETTPLLYRSHSQSDIAKVKGDWLGALYGMLGGTVASETLLLTKSGVELLIVSIFQTDNQFRGAFSFCLLAVLCFTVFLQLYSLNRGMHYSLPTMIIPIFYTFYTVLSLFNTLVYLDQFDDYKGPDLVCIAIGVIGIITGVWLLARGHGVDEINTGGDVMNPDFNGSRDSLLDEDLASQNEAVVVGVEAGDETRRRVGRSETGVE